MIQIYSVVYYNMFDFLTCSPLLEISRLLWEIFSLALESNIMKIISEIKVNFISQYDIPISWVIIHQ